MNDGFVRIACITPAIRVADCAFNAQSLMKLICQADSQGAALAITPELGLTGYTCGDLFLQPTLLQGAEQALEQILEQSSELQCVLVVGLPVAIGAALYNCAAVVHAGRLLGLIPKTHIPNYGEFYEGRHFSPAPPQEIALTFAGQRTILSSHQLFRCRQMPKFTFGIEICEDLWVSEPPSGALVHSGATIIGNLSASNEIIGKAAYRRQLVQSQSARLLCAYAYADAGRGESSTDLVFSGHNLIGDNGKLGAESRLFSTGLIQADGDVERLSGERQRISTFPPLEQSCRVQEFDYALHTLTLLQAPNPTPFVPAPGEGRDQCCQEILSIQAAGLAKRLEHTGGKTAVVGLSGGLDSTLALIVTVHAFDSLSLPRSGILTVTMPCFGTTSRTKNNACALAKAYGVSFQEVAIGQAVNQHFSDIGHDPESLDVTFENAQARERTQVLMDLANQQGALVVGTGDLSELALGWATYNGDHMSMYGVNASIPKTLVRHLVGFEAQRSLSPLKETLLDIVGTPVSPELLPPVDGEISQKTEELVGPYELHDFFLYYFLRFAFPPAKIFRLAKAAFAGVYDERTIKRWLCAFLRRFFSQQFKRSCLPDGPKVGTVSLSPRGDWRMPSDASAALWLRQAEAL